jgi:hypothetical protein
LGKDLQPSLEEMFARIGPEQKRNCVLWWVKHNGWLYGLGNPVNSTDFTICAISWNPSFRSLTIRQFAIKRHCGRELITNELIHSISQERACECVLSEQNCYALKIG